MKTKHRVWSYIVLGLVVVAFFGLSFLFPGLKQFASPEFVRTFVLGFGGFAFVIYMVLVTLAVPLPVPSTAAILAGGYIFGTAFGMLLALISMIAGSTLSFYLIRWVGRPLLEKLVDARHIKHFNAVFKKRGKAAVLISYAIPIFPSDMVSLFLGLTKIRYLTFLFLVVLGHIPRLFIITSFGSDLYSGFTVQTFLVAIAAIAFVLIVAFREKIKRVVFAELRTLKRELGSLKKS